MTLKHSEDIDKIRSELSNDHKQQCDDYFYLKHRKEMRGIGGIFFDDLNHFEFDKLLQWVSNLGETFTKAYKPILELALKSEGKVRLYAGVLPQPFADKASRLGLKAVLLQIKSR